MQIMREMAKEMTKMGIIEEIVEETMESFEPENMEELAQEEVDRVLWEVTAGELGRAPAAVSDALEQQKEERAKAIATADEFIASQQASHT
jgi:charged multivesicular body protein 3